MSTTFADHLLTGDHASRPAATAVPAGTLYACSDHDLIYQSDGATWSTWATIGGAAALDDLTDVVITAGASGDILRHNGTNWVDAAGIVATDITSGTVPTARLGSGTADATTFLRGDQTYAAPAGGGSNIVLAYRNPSASGTFLTVASNAAFDIGSPSLFTVRMWVMPLTPNTNNGLATRSSLSSSQGDWALGFFAGTGTARPTLRLNNNAASVQSTTDLKIGVWHFVEASYDSSLGSNNMKLFIDGVLDVQGNYSTVISNNANPLRVGTYFLTTNGFIGCISEFEFCANFVRNTSGYTPPSVITPDANTTVHWSMDEYVGAGVTDDSGNGFNGSVGGSYPTLTDTGFRKL